MANYESVTRSNYFHVKDEDAFSKFMDTVSGDDMHCWSDKDEDSALQRFHEYHEMDPDKYARAIIRDNMTRKEKTYA